MSSYEPIPREEPLYPRLEPTPPMNPHAQTQQPQPHVQVQINPQLNWQASPQAQVYALPVAPSFQVVVPPAPTPEELQQKLAQRRVVFDGSQYIRDGWNIARHNCCTIFGVMLAWMAIGVVVHAVLFGIALGPQYAGKFDDYDWNGNTTAVAPPPPVPDSTFEEDEENDIEPRLSPVARVVIGLFSEFLVFSPLTAGCFIAVFAALRTNSHLKFAHFFHGFQCPYYFRLLALSLLLHIGRSLGFHLLVIPGIWFAVISTFALPLHVENRFLGACTAIKSSYKILKSYFWNMLGFGLLLVLFNIMGLLFLGVGLLVTLPVSFFALCSCYNHLVGVNGCPVMIPVSGQQPQQPQPPQQVQQIQVQPQQSQPQPVYFTQVPTPLPPVAAPVSFLPPRSGNHYTQLPTTTTPSSPITTTTSQYVASPTTSNLYTPTTIPPSTVNPYPGQL